nr:glycosyltransferase [uncultured Desulfobacter sp.]
MFLGVLNSIRKIKKKFNFDIIDAHWIYPDCFAAVLLAKWFNKKVVISARGSDINAYTKLFLIRILIQYTLKQADAIIAVSHDLKNKIQEMGINESKIKVISNGVDTDQFRPLPKNQLEAVLPFEKKGRLILTVGALRKVKNQHLLIEAFSQIVSMENYEDLKLVIVGSGTQKHALKEQIYKLKLSNQIFLVGAVPNDRLVHWYNHADLFCLPSLNEGCPNVVLEALACHVPVVATNVGGIPDLISSENIGILADPGSLDSLKTSLIQGLEKKWTSLAFQKFLSGKSWDRVAQEVGNLFLEIKNQKKK